MTVPSWLPVEFYHEAPFPVTRKYDPRFVDMVTAVFVSAWYFYDVVDRNIIHQYFMIIVVVMAVAKLSAMLYYRFTD